MILEAIYSGDFYPSETVVLKSEKYRNALKACEKIMDRLAEKLSKEDYDLVKNSRIRLPSPSVRRMSATSRLASQQECWYIKNQWRFSNVIGNNQKNNLKDKM